MLTFQSQDSFGNEQLQRFHHYGIGKTSFRIN